jgi:hypothetical protein
MGALDPPDGIHRPTPICHQGKTNTKTNHTTTSDALRLPTPASIAARSATVRPDSAEERTG